MNKKIFLPMLLVGSLCSIELVSNPLSHLGNRCFVGVLRGYDKTYNFCADSVVPNKVQNYFSGKADKVIGILSPQMKNYCESKISPRAQRFYANKFSPGMKKFNRKRVSRADRIIDELSPSTKKTSELYKLIGAGGLIGYIKGFKTGAIVGASVYAYKNRASTKGQNPSAA